MGTNANTYVGSSSANSSLVAFLSNSGSTDYSKGFELRIPNYFFGSITSSIKLFPMIVNTPFNDGVNNGTIVSNQFLSPAGSGEGSYGSGSISFSSLAPGPVSFSISSACYDEECLTVKESPTVSSPSSVCVGDQITLSPTSGGTWSSGNTGYATVTNAGVVTGVAGGSTSFTFTTDDGCSSSTGNVNVKEVKTSEIQTN